MKIIKPGRVAEELAGVCHAYGCEVECGSREAQLLERASAERCYAVCCPTPTCGRWVYLRAKGEPSITIERFEETS